MVDIQKFLHHPAINGFYSRKVILPLTILVFVVFLISSHMAYLNPRPGFQPRCRASQTYPFMWQYNSDSIGEIATAMNWPMSLKEMPSRTNRATYMLATRAGSEVIQALASPFYDVKPYQATAAAFGILNCLLAVVAGFVGYLVLRRWMDHIPALLGTLLLYSQVFTIKILSLYHTHIFHFITPVAVAYLFLDLMDRYSHKRNFYYALIMGVLLLAKENYAAYLTMLALFVLERKFVPLVLNFCAHLVPLLIWMIVLRIIDIEFYVVTVQRYNEGTWIFDMLFSGEVIPLAWKLLESIPKYFVLLYETYRVWFLFAIAALLLLRKEIWAKNRNLVLFFLLTLGTCWMQAVASHRYQARMVGDVGFLVYGLGAFGFYRFVMSRLSWTGHRLVLPALVLLWLAYSVFSIMNFPLVAPADQIDPTSPFK